MRRDNDPTLPPAMRPAPSLRETIYGVADRASLDASATELRKDREIRCEADGTIGRPGFVTTDRFTGVGPFMHPPVAGGRAVLD